MIIHASMRTDIPAFYSEWFTNRIREGYVRVRNPYDPLQVTEYSLDPEVVDLIVFCSKNPVPMLKYMDLLTSYRTYWYITNYDEKSVRLNRINHNPKSAFLIGNDMPNDKVHKAVQKSWINGQISLNGFFI